MKTVFYYPEVRQVAVGQEGGAVRYVLPARPRRRPLPPVGDNVLDFDACRRALAGEEEEPPRERPARRGDRLERLGLALDLCATAAIVIFAAVTIAHMLGAL